MRLLMRWQPSGVWRSGSATLPAPTRFATSWPRRASYWKTRRTACAGSGSRASWFGAAMEFEVDVELEEDGRWIAAIERLPGVLAYGSTREEAKVKAEALAQEVVQEQAPH